MAAVTIRGDVPNLTLIKEDIAPHLPTHSGSEATIVASPDDGHSLGNAQWGELVIHIGEGLVVRAIWAAITAAVDKARRRGRIEVEVPEELRGIDPTPAEGNKATKKGEDDGVGAGSGGQ